MANIINFGGYDNNGKWISCFPEGHDEIAHQEDGYNKLTDKIKANICDDVDWIINQINKRRREGDKSSDIIDGELQRRGLGSVNDFDTCSQIKVFYNDREGKSSTVLENFITDKVVPFWLKCWQKNNVTIIITKSWPNAEAKSFFKLYVDNYCSSKTHLVYILLENDNQKDLLHLIPTK